MKIFTATTRPAAGNDGNLIHTTVVDSNITWHPSQNQGKCKRDSYCL